jgi:hypothetical protein
MPFPPFAKMPMLNFTQLRKFWQKFARFRFHVNHSDISILCKNQQTITIFEIIFAKIIYIFHFRENHRCFTYFRDSLPTVVCPENIFSCSKSSLETNSTFFWLLWMLSIVFETVEYIFFLSPFIFPFFLYSIALWYSPFNQGVANIQNPQHFGLQATNFFIGKDE